MLSLYLLSWKKVMALDCNRDKENGKVINSIFCSNYGTTKASIKKYQAETSRQLETWLSHLHKRPGNTIADKSEMAFKILDILEFRILDCKTKLLKSVCLCMYIYILILSFVTKAFHRPVMFRFGFQRRSFSKFMLGL